MFLQSLKAIAHASEDSIQQALRRRQRTALRRPSRHPRNLGGDGQFTQGCRQVLKDRFGIKELLLVPSSTAALEMAAMLLNLRPDDEVILPSYTFVSTANCFVRLAAWPVFVDIRPDTLNIDEGLIEEATTDQTRAIFPFTMRVSVARWTGS
jgi:dTDP-4-amino-4,6-dideoxygalactose transaminase